MKFPNFTFMPAERDQLVCCGRRKKWNGAQHEHSRNIPVNGARTPYTFLVIAPVNEYLKVPTTCWVACLPKNGRREKHEIKRKLKVSFTQF